MMESLEPFGDRRGDLQAAITASTIANVNRPPRTRPFEVAQFLPEWEKRPVSAQTAEQQLEMILMLQAAQNAKLDS